MANICSVRNNISTDDNANANKYIGTEIWFDRMMKKEGIWWPDSHSNDKTHTDASNTSQGEIESDLVNTFENRQFLKDNLENYEVQFSKKEVNYGAWRGILSWKKPRPSQRLREIDFAEYFWPFALNQVLLHHHLDPVPVPKHDDGVGEHKQVAANHQPSVREDRLRAEQGRC